MINLINEENYFDDKKEIDLNALIENLNRIFDSAMQVTNQTYSPLSMSLQFVSKSQIQSLNLKMRQIDKTTDVLSFPSLDINCGEVIDKNNFPYDIDEITKELNIGDCIICYDIAKEQAQEYNHSIMREICYLFVHSVLHLLGFDHIKDIDKKVMREKEEQILNALNITREL